MYVISYFINFVLKQNYRLQTHPLYVYTFDRGFSGDTTYGIRASVTTLGQILGSI